MIFHGILRLIEAIILLTAFIIGLVKSEDFPLFLLLIIAASIFMFVRGINSFPKYYKNKK